VIESSSVFLVKAREALAGAESEYANGRFNNCANRAYYACFLAALHALAQVGIQPPGDDQRMSSSKVSSLANWWAGGSYTQMTFAKYSRPRFSYARQPITRRAGSRSVRHRERCA
jgi:hypothetical protein